MPKFWRWKIANHSHEKTIDFSDLSPSKKKTRFEHHKSNLLQKMSRKLFREKKRANKMTWRRARRINLISEKEFQETSREKSRKELQFSERKNKERNISERKNEETKWLGEELAGLVLALSPAFIPEVSARARSVVTARRRHAFSTVPGFIDGHVRGGVGGRIRRWMGAMWQQSFVPSTGDAWVALEAVPGRTGGKGSCG